VAAARIKGHSLQRTSIEKPQFSRLRHEQKGKRAALLSSAMDLIRHLDFLLGPLPRLNSHRETIGKTLLPLTKTVLFHMKKKKRKKNQFFKVYVNQVSLKYRHYLADSNFNLFHFVISIIYIQFFHN
jgi:hypothetical protein